MFRKALFAVALVALIAPLAHAQTVDEILAQHFTASGGLEKMRAVKTLRMVGKMTVGPGMESPFTMDRKRPNLQRVDFTFQGMTGTQAFDGKRAWAVMPFMGKKDPEPASDEDSKEAADQADFDGALVDWKDKGHQLELIGKESVEGAEAWKLKLTKKSGSIDYYYIDTDTKLLLKEEGKRTIRGTEVEGESTFGDYKEVEGMLMPFSMTNAVKGSERKQTMTFDKIETNVAMDDAHFMMPAVAASDSAKADSAKAAVKPVAVKKDAKPATPAKKK
jgi:hypothetical protein